MQKPDYVKNTRGEGIADAILECLYENISYTPFIYIEDANPHGRQAVKPRRTLFRTTSSENLARSSREPVDPYALILDGKLDLLRPSLKDVMVLDDLYSCNGTDGPPDMDSLHHAFAKTGVLQIVSARSRPDAFMPASLQNPAGSNPGLVDIKVAKVGLLWRKDAKKRRGRSPWQEWGALLTFSQLYLFRDVNWVKSLMSQSDAQQTEGHRRAVVFKPPITEFNPDALMSTDDAVALLDLGYKKHKHAFVFLRHGALEETFLANNEADMNDWIAKLNYAAAFRTTGVRTKGMIATGYDAQRNRMGHTDSNQSPHSTNNEPPSPNPDTDVAEELITARRHLMLQRIRDANEKLFVCQKQLDDLLRNARHLQVLTPVHTRAREQVIMAAAHMAAKLKWVRQDIWRTKCHREVLVRDLDDDELDAETSVEQTNIPMADTSISETGTLGPTANAKYASPTNDSSAAGSADIPSSIDQVSLSQPMPTDGRRTSLPASATSPELARPDRRCPADSTERTTSCPPGAPRDGLERKTSVLSSGSKMDASSLGSHASKLASHTSIDDNEERLLRESGLLEVDSSAQGQRRGSGAEQNVDGPLTKSQEELPGRARRSLPRTLRDSGSQGSQIRNKKTRGSTSSNAAPDDEQETKQDEGLPRKTPSFTFHGKKASIVTFGSEWQNMSPEERLKLRKPTPSDDPKASDPSAASIADSATSESLSGGRPQSLRSASTATKSFRFHDDSPEALGILGGSEKTFPETDANSARAPTFNGRLALPTDNPATVEDEDTLDQQPKTELSVQGQAVNA